MSGLPDAITRIQANDVKLDAIVNGPASGDGSTVTTDGGDVRTIAKLEADIQATADAILAPAEGASDTAVAAAATATTQAGIATTQAGVSTAQATIATTQATTATAQAGTATTQAGIATTAAGISTAQATIATTQATTATTQAGTATTQAGIATTQAGIATDQASASTTQANNAATSATSAASSAASAATSYANTVGVNKIYTDTTTGLANTSGTGATNRYFSVPSTSANGFVDLYLNNGGAAVFQVTYPNLASALTAGGQLLNCPPESGYVAAMVDANGRMSWSVLADGTFVPNKIVLPALSVSRASVSADVASSLVDAGVGSIFKALPTESGYSAAVVDANGRMSWSVDVNGQVYPRSLKVPAGTIVDDLTTLTLSQRLFAAPIGSLYQALPVESGYCFAIVDSNGRMIFGVPASGTTTQAVVARALTADNATPQGAARENPAYIVVPYTDGAGKRQLRSIRKSDGQVFALTSTGNNIDPTITSGNKVLFATDASGSFVSRYIGAEGGTSYPVEPDPGVIDPWGNSLTAGAGSSGSGAGQGPWPSQLALMSGRTVNNRGIGGQTSSQIIARQGGAPTLITVTGNSIAASGVTTVTAYSQDIFFQSGGHAATSQTGTLAGVAGTLAGDTSGNYTFTRAVAGAAVACAAGTPFIPDLAVASQTRLQIIEVGRNNYSAQAQILSDIAAGVAYLRAYSPRFLLLNILNGTTETSGSSAYNTIMATNAAVLAAYPNNVVDVRSPPTTAEMAALGFTPNSTDLADIANDCIPTGMRAGAGDTLHLNNYGYALWTLRIYNKLISKGW